VDLHLIARATGSRRSTASAVRVVIGRGRVPAPRQVAAPAKPVSPGHGPNSGLVLFIFYPIFIFHFLLIFSKFV
jgi:hypothetical protein